MHDVMHSNPVVRDTLPTYVTHGMSFLVEQYSQMLDTHRELNL